MTPPPATTPPLSAQAHPGRRRRLAERLRFARPSPAELLGGAVLWGLLMALSALFALYLLNRMETSHLHVLALLYFSGGLLAWLACLPLARFLAHGRAVETRFAACFLTLTCGTILVTAFIFAMDYRLFYARWHQPFGTRIWALQFLFTSAAAAYQFLVMGVRLFLPLGFVFLMAASLYLSRPMR